MKQYARGSRAFGICGRSGRKMLLKDMVFDERFPNMRVDPAWLERRHPQETLPRVEDPIALYRPSPEVIAAPTAPVLAVVAAGLNLQLTWQPSETGITEIKSYDIYRGTDGATPTLLINCPVRRDFLGGIKSIDHCTIANPPEHPDDPWTNVIEDSPVTYLDTAVVAGHTYCYYVIGNPLGNNLSTAQGPPSAPSNTACVGAPYQATPPVLSGALSGTNVVLNWTAATITGSTITNYLLYRNVDGGAFSLFQTLGNVLTYTDTTTAVGHTYGYNVVGVPAVGANSVPSNTVFETPVSAVLWTEVDGFVFAELGFVTAVAVIDANHAVVSTSAAWAITSNAGSSWTLVSVGAADAFYQMATDGTRVIGAAGGAGTATLWYSANQGVSWTNVTPGGFSANDGLFYFPGIGKFVAFDSHVNPGKVATSATGALGTWTVTPMPNQVVLGNSPSSAVEANGVLITGGDTGGAQPAVIERSTDGDNWTVKASYNPGAFAAFETFAYNGVVWNATGNDAASGNHWFNYTSTDNGLTWTQRVVGPQTAPPFISQQVALGTVFLTSNGSDNKIGRSTDNGVSWSTVTVSALTVIKMLKVFGGKCYAFGDGVAVSSDGLTWTQELALAGGDLLIDATDAGGAGGLTLAIGSGFSGALSTIYKRTPGV